MLVPAANRESVDAVRPINTAVCNVVGQRSRGFKFTKAFLGVSIHWKAVLLAIAFVAVYILGKERATILHHGKLTVWNSLSPASASVYIL